MINPELLARGWDEHFGYLKESGYAVVIVEFGGNPDWPDKAEVRDRNRYAYLTDKTVDWQWQNAFVDYLVSKGITDTIYWSINPESLNAGGIYMHAYDASNNTPGWGTWLSPDKRKLDMLDKLRREPPTPKPGKGDVNGDYVINIIDALMTAQYYVGLNPPGFLVGNADVDCDGRLTIIDALIIAQYYVGLLSSFLCY